MSKHTPGPWKVEPASNGQFWVRQTGLGGFSISLIGHEAAEANARLISAAPDLLSIARLALKASQIDINDFMGRIEVNVLLGMIGGAAKVALAKVEGKEEVFNEAQ